VKPDTLGPIAISAYTLAITASLFAIHFRERTTPAEPPVWTLNVVADAGVNRLPECKTIETEYGCIEAGTYEGSILLLLGHNYRVRGELKVSWQHSPVMPCPPGYADGSVCMDRVPSDTATIVVSP